MNICGNTVLVSCPPPTTLLSAGGCHVNGYPLGEPWSFSELAARELGHDSVRIAPICLKNSSALFEYLDDNPPPDALVLQFGNYEVPPPLMKHFRAMVSGHLGWMTNHIGFSSASSSKGLMLPPEQVFEAGMAWKMRVVIKQRYAQLAQRLSPPLFDPQIVQQGLRSLLDRLTPYRIPAVVVLSPLPCADHMARRFRIESSGIFQEEAKSAGALWLDTAQVLGYSGLRSKRSFDIYADERHLNARGHRMLADALVATLADAASTRKHESQSVVHTASRYSTRVS